MSNHNVIREFNTPNCILPVWYSARVLQIAYTWQDMPQLSGETGDQGEIGLSSLQGGNLARIAWDELNYAQYSQTRSVSRIAPNA